MHSERISGAGSAVKDEEVVRYWVAYSTIGECHRRASAVRKEVVAGAAWRGMREPTGACPTLEPINCDRSFSNHFCNIESNVECDIVRICVCFRTQ